MQTTLPGLKASHQMITPTCRENRGDDGAFEEAIARIRRTYDSCVGHEANGEVTWHLALVRAEPGEGT
jgi:hypothetical protein